jgi:3-dehydroquinate synthase
VSEVELLGYRVSVGSGLLHQVGALVTKAAPAHRYALITDSVVGPLYADTIMGAMSAHAPGAVIRYQVTAGEERKTRDSWASLTDRMLADGLGRDTTVLALGGGVIGDLAGFVAATYMRGIPVVQLPTSLLSMVDAGIGGKTGVDTPAGKNLVGAFHQPAAVIVDVAVLHTLPGGQLRAGFAEIVKHGVIADAAYLDQASAAAAYVAGGTASDETLHALVLGSVRIKASFVADDEREAGRRKALNFGHTIAHAVESASGYATRHGDAVAIGMVAEARMAERMGIAPAGVAERIEDILQRASLPVALPRDMDPARMLALTATDKKARHGVVEYTLPAAIGQMASCDGRWSVPVPDALVLEVLGAMR